MDASSLVDLQREGRLYWLDPEPFPLPFRPAPVPIQLSQHRRDFTEDVLRAWAVKGALYTPTNKGGQ